MTKNSAIKQLVAQTEAELVPVGHHALAPVILGAKRLTIGRHENCDVCIPDQSVSRFHALITMRPEGEYFIADNQSKNGILVNGKKVSSVALVHGDVVQIGDYKFNFQNPDSQEVGFQKQSSPKKKSLFSFGKKKKKKSGGSNNRIKIYVGAIALFLMWFLLSSPSEDKKSIETKDKSKVNQEIKREDFKATSEKKESEMSGLEPPEKSETELRLEKLDWSDESVRKSEDYFKRGRREFLNHNYIRSINYFNTALTFNKKHAQAKNYLTLSMTYADRESKRHLDMGFKYFETLQFQRAIYHFKQAVEYSSYKKNSEIIKVSQKYILFSKKRLKAAELFP